MEKGPEIFPSQGPSGDSPKDKSKGDAVEKKSIFSKIKESDSISQPVAPSPFARVSSTSAPPSAPSPSPPPHDTRPRPKDLYHAGILNPFCPDDALSGDVARPRRRRRKGCRPYNEPDIPTTCPCKSDGGSIA